MDNLIVSEAPFDPSEFTELDTGDGSCELDVNLSDSDSYTCGKKFLLFSTFEFIFCSFKSD